MGLLAVKKLSAFQNTLLGLSTYYSFDGLVKWFVTSASFGNSSACSSTNGKFSAGGFNCL